MRHFDGSSVEWLIDGELLVILSGLFNVSTSSPVSAANAVRFSSSRSIAHTIRPINPWAFAKSIFAWKDFALSKL
jgi:hypothetical protein